MQKIKKCDVSSFGSSAQNSKIEEANNHLKKSEKNNKGPPKKKNKIERAKDDLIAWIVECIFYWVKHI